LVNPEQAGQVDTSSSVRGHEMRSPSITTSGEDILAAKLGGLSWQMRECWEKNRKGLRLVGSKPRSKFFADSHGCLGEIT
jgi:hypothetical protein